MLRDRVVRDELWAIRAGDAAGRGPVRSAVERSSDHAPVDHLAVPHGLAVAGSADGFRTASDCLAAASAVVHGRDLGADVRFGARAGRVEHTSQGASYRRQPARLKGAAGFAPAIHRTSVSDQTVQPQEGRPPTECGPRAGREQVRDPPVRDHAVEAGLTAPAQDSLAESATRAQPASLG